ncbi:MAG: 50S ribosomal protein L30 [Thermoleophilaceae bacterium]|jgi:large subunit ribosomal protein L30
MAKLTLTQRRSTNGASPRQRAALRTLGLGKIGRTVERPDEPTVRGAVRVVGHLVEVKE